MDYEISTLKTLLDKKIECLNGNRLKIDRIAHGIANATSIKEKNEIKLFLANEINEAKLNRQFFEQQIQLHKECLERAFDNKGRQLWLNEIIQLQAIFIQNGLEILRELDANQNKLWKLIRNSIALDHHSFVYGRIFVKKINFDVFKKFNKISSHVNQLQGTMHPKLWKKLMRILIESADKIKEKAIWTMLSIQQNFKVPTTNIAKATRKSKDVITESIRKCLAVFNFVILKIKTFWHNHGRDCSIQVKKKCLSKKYMKNESAKSFNERNTKSKIKRNLIKKIKKVKKAFMLNNIGNLFRLTNWKFRKKC